MVIKVVEEFGVSSVEELVGSLQVERTCEAIWLYTEAQVQALSPCPPFFTWLTVFTALDSLSLSQDGSTFLPNGCPLLKRLKS